MAEIAAASGGGGGGGMSSYGTENDDRLVGTYTPANKNTERQLSDNAAAGAGRKTLSSLGQSSSSTKGEKKIGHRRVDPDGETTYKKTPSSELMQAIQLGIGHAVGSLSSKPERDVLLQDFSVVQTVFFPKEGSNITAAHSLNDFRFKNYAPVAFRYFRDLFGIHADDFMLSLCSETLRELSNPGASGSVFYITRDDEFIVKTVQHKEAEFLQKLLPGYYMNLNQNPRTLLPKFYGQYCYQCGGKNIRLAVMNNLLPTSIKMHQKYDIKGSTFGRRASKSERAKKSPTLKDLDFLEDHPDGLLLEPDTWNALVKTIQRDCRVLESFKIMDYSLLVGIHNTEMADREAANDCEATPGDQTTGDPTTSQQPADTSEWPSSSVTTTALARGEKDPTSPLQRTKSYNNKQRLAQYSTALESIDHKDSKKDRTLNYDSTGGIPARNSKGERLLLFLGIIDILQRFQLKKKLEHTWKSMFHDGDTVSVHRPNFYSQRFIDFLQKSIFIKKSAPLKHSPSKKKSMIRKHQSGSTSDSHDPGGSVRDRRQSVETDQPGTSGAYSSRRTSSISEDPDQREVYRTQRSVTIAATPTQQQQQQQQYHQPSASMMMDEEPVPPYPRYSAEGETHTRHPLIHSVTAVTDSFSETQVDEKDTVSPPKDPVHVTRHHRTHTPRATDFKSPRHHGRHDDSPQLDSSPVILYYKPPGRAVATPPRPAPPRPDPPFQRSHHHRNNRPHHDHRPAAATPGNGRGRTPRSSSPTPDQAMYLGTF